jgi:exodeoxyribonuclease VII large subunit
MSEKNAHSLYELNEYIKRVVSLNFNETLWISCEISQANSSRGHYYLELDQKNEDSNEIIAQMSAVIWVKNFLFIKRKLGDVADLILVNGSQVLLKVKLDFNERYGLKLIIEDIDASYTIGQMEIARQKTLERLKKENLIHLNSQNDIPQVIQRIAVISSKTAAGYQDFIQHLTNNSYGYQYKTTLFQTAMQGINTEKELLQSMNQILENKEHFS